MGLGTSETQTFVDGHIMAGSKEDADQDHHTGNCQYSAKEVPSEESHGVIMRDPASARHSNFACTA